MSTEELDPRLIDFIGLLPAHATPICILQALSTFWTAETALHRGLSESALLAQTVAVLRASGVAVINEPRGWKGHADIVVDVDHRDTPKHLVQQGRGLVANALQWSGPSAFRESLDRLVPQVTKFDRHAAIIVHVREGGLSQVMQGARFVCEKHPAFGNFGKALVDNQMKLWLSISKNSDKVIQTTLLFCDLFEGVTRGGIDAPSEPEPWEPQYGMY